MLRQTLIILSLWLIAFVVGLVLDRPVAQFVHDRGWDNKRAWSKKTHRIVETIKLPGEFTATIVAAGGLLVFHRLRWRAAGLVALSGALSGLNGLLKWIAGRRRPVAKIAPFDIEPFVGGFAGLMGSEKNLGFPSGHACLAFANAAALAYCLPSWRWVFYGVATIVAIERVAENAHYVSDSIAGAAVGVLAAVLAKWIWKRIVRESEEQRIR